MLKVRFLGQYEVRLDDQPVEIPSRPAQALLAFLILNAGVAERREKLAALLWPESEEANARSYLRHALWRLRKSLAVDQGSAGDYFIADDLTIAFDGASDYWLDVAHLDKQEDDSWGVEDYIQAVSVYRGDLLPGFDHEWIYLERERLRAVFQRKMQALMDLLVDAGRWSEVLEWGERWIALGGTPEPAFRALMKAHYALGDLSNVAAVYQRCVSALRQDLDVEPSELTKDLYARLREGEVPLPEPSSEAVKRDLHPAPGEPPYKGLQFFDRNDAELFFGREALTARIVSLFKEAPPGSQRGKWDRFLAVVGDSGSGKSSLLRAGVAPALSNGKPSGSGAPSPGVKVGWEIQVFTPTAHPLEALATSLTRQIDSVSVTANLIKDLAIEPNALHLFARKTLGNQTEGDGWSSGRRLLLVIDQFEELFTLCRDEVQRKAFIDNLMTAVELDGPVCVLIALRADFYVHCSPFKTLREALELEQVYIGSMNEEELHRAVTEPAEREGWTFEPGLAEFILQQVGDEPGALPLLSHVLLETWRRRRGRTLTYVGYNESGGLRGAIAKTADRVLTRFDPEQQAIARSLFTRLTELGEGAPDTRRRVALEELKGLPEDENTVEAVLGSLAEARLITIGEDTVVVSHEALIREWPTLRQWLDEDRAALQIHRHLTESAQAWERMGRDAGELYRGARLAQAAEWAEGRYEKMTPLEREFLGESQALARQREAEREARRQRELEAAQQLAAEQARASRGFRWLSLGLAILLLIAAGSALLAVRQTNQIARQARLAASRELAAEAITNLDVDPDRSILLALSAVSNVHSQGLPVPRQAEEALHRAIQASRLRLTVPGAFGVDFSPDGARLAASGPDSTAIIRDAKDGRELLTLAGHSEDLFGVDVRFSPDGNRLVTASADGTARVWDSTTGEEIVAFTGHSAGVHFAIFTPDGTRVASAGDDGTVRIWDAQTGRQLVVIEQPNVVGFAINRQGTRLAVTYDDIVSGVVTIWDPDSGQQLFTIPGGSIALDFSPDGERLAIAYTNGRITVWDIVKEAELLTLPTILPLRSLAFSPDGARLATGGANGVANVWEVASGDLVLTLTGHSGAIWNLDFSPDGNQLATAGTGGLTRVWDVTPEGGREQLTLAGHTSVVFSADFSSDGGRLATSSWDGTAIVWVATSGERLLTLDDFDAQLARMRFSPDDAKLATADFSGIVGVWDAATGEQLLSIEAHSPGDIDVAFSPDGTRLATGGSDNLVKLWDAVSGELIATLSGHDAPISRLALNSDGTLLATASVDGTARVWDLPSKQELYRFSPVPGNVWNVDFSPDGASLVTAHEDGVARVWDLIGEGREVLTLTGHSGIVLDAAISPDGSHIATLSFDSTARLWDAATGQELLVLGTNDNGADLDFSPDGKYLATTNGDGEVQIYVLPVEDLMALARERLTRTWTPEECRRYLRAETCPPDPLGEG